MIVYVDLEHERLANVDAKKWRDTAARRLRTKYLLEDITDDECLVVRYRKVSPGLLRQINARALVVSGNNTEFEHYVDSKLSGLRAIYAEPALPILAFCGGFHLLVQTHGAEIGPMGHWRADDTRPSDEQEISPGMRQEKGFGSVRVKDSNPLFNKLADEVTVFQSHYWEAKTGPSDFSVSAESDLCPIQALQHRSAPVLGTQFHPEEHDERHPDGRQIICNFFQYVGL